MMPHWLLSSYINQIVIGTFEFHMGSKKIHQTFSTKNNHLSTVGSIVTIAFIRVRHVHVGLFKNRSPPLQPRCIFLCVQKIRLN